MLRFSFYGKYSAYTSTKKQPVVKFTRNSTMRTARDSLDGLENNLILSNKTINEINNMQLKSIIQLLHRLKSKDSTLNEINIDWSSDLTTATIPITLWVELAKYIKNNYYLTSIILKNVNMTDANCTMLLYAISTCVNLTTLNLELNQLTIRSLQRVSLHVTLLFIFTYNLYIFFLILYLLYTYYTYTYIYSYTPLYIGHNYDR